MELQQGASFAIPPLALLLAAFGLAWGFVADRIAARWPRHDDGSVRKIDWRTPVTILIAGAAFAGLGIRWGDPIAPIPLVVFGADFVVLTLLLATDLDQRLLPDVLTLPLALAGLLFALTGQNPIVPWAGLPWAVATAIGIPLGLFLLSIPFGKGALAEGDLKLLLSIGIFAGMIRAFSGVLVGGLVAGVVVGLLLVTKRVGLRTYIPFGPFLIIGAFWSVLFHIT